MATLAAGGRITAAVVADEIERLRGSGGPAGDAGTAGLEPFLGGSAIEPLDHFDRAQLSEVLRVCLASRSLSDAGRALFAASRGRRASTNDADRLRKYLARFGLSWQVIQERR